MGLKRFFSRVLLGSDGGKWKDGIWVPGRDVAQIEPYTAAQVTHNFTATVDDEISVTRGARLRAMYKEQEWIYVEAADGKRGFVPHDFCSLKLDKNKKEEKRSRKAAQKLLGNAATAETEKKWEKSNLDRFLDSLPMVKTDGEPFELRALGSTTVLFPFQGAKSDDLSVAANEKVIVLNVDDHHWLYVRDSEGGEGFVPSTYLDWDPHNTKESPYDVQDLLVVDDFGGRSTLDLGVEQGEWITAVYDESSHWLWASRGKDGREGFVPTSVVVLATDL